MRFGGVEGAYGGAGQFLNAPTITGNARGVPTILSQSGIPFIHLSSGSVSAVGAISAITALPLAYANAYCYFPANILATVHAGGWCYCTFSTTTAGTAFLDTYTSGTPTIPTSPTAVTDGKGAFTGDTTERPGPVITVPANAMGANGALDIAALWSSTANANTKTARVRHSGAAGTQFHNLSHASQQIEQSYTRIANRGSTQVQVGPIGGFSGIGLSNGGANLLGTADTTAATTVVLSVHKATATDNHVLEFYQVNLHAAA